MEQGPNEQFIIRQCLREKQPFPKAIENAPELMFGLEFFFNAFFDLCSCRVNSMQHGEIPWTAIQLYCTANGLSPNEAEDMHFLIASMDRAYLTLMKSKEKK